MPDKTKVNRAELWVGALVAIGGADLAIMFNKLAWWVGVIVLTFGIFMMLHATDRLGQGRLTEIFRAGRIEDSKAIGRRLIKRLTGDGVYVRAFQLIGVALMTLVMIYNITLASRPEIGTYDIVLLLLGFALLVYPYFWMRFPKEMDFVLIFFGILAIEVVLIIIILGPDPGFVPSPAGDFYVENFLSAPLVGLLSLSGVSIDSLHSVGPIIYFFDQHGNPVSVGIAISCSGLYSIAIFLAAFFAFILAFYSKLDRRTGLLLVIGTVAAYLANILRMYLVLMAGYFNGMGGDGSPFTLLWVHKYAGEVIFICWIALFWWIAFKFFAPEEDEKGKEPPSEGEEERGEPEAAKEKTSAGDPE